MRILLTNDDGFGSDGIVALDRALTDAGHEIYVCAPEGQRSAFSHAITISRRGVTMKKITEHRYSCSGTPADCVLFFLGGRMSEGLPDLIISGINIGFNASSDIIYSGTVAAAREAMIHGIPSIAISLQDPKRGESVKDLDFGPAAMFLSENLEALYPFCRGNSFLNINIPKVFRPGFKVGTIGVLDYHDTVQLLDQGVAGVNYIIDGGGSPTIEDEKGETDLQLVRDQWISVTPIKVLPDLDPDKASALEKLGNR